MGKEKEYHVTITEEITEIRELKVTASSVDEAHRKAYDSWVGDGKADDPVVMVNERTFTIQDLETGESEDRDDEPDDEGEGEEE